jgi:hypothetical protein
MVFGKLMSILTLETDASIDSLEHALLWLQDSRVRIRFVSSQVAGSCSKSRTTVTGSGPCAKEGGFTFCKPRLF